MEEFPDLMLLSNQSLNLEEKLPKDQSKVFSPLSQSIRGFTGQILKSISNKNFESSIKPSDLNPQLSTPNRKKTNFNLRKAVKANHYDKQILALNEEKHQVNYILVNYNT